MITVPQAIAYAFLAGLPPEAGLYACLAPMVIYAVLGSSKQMVVGPVAVAALMVAAAVGETRRLQRCLSGHHHRAVPAGRRLLWLLRLSNMGGVVNLLSHPGHRRLRQRRGAAHHHQPARAADRHRPTQSSNRPLDQVLNSANPRQLNPVALGSVSAAASVMWLVQRY